MVINGRPLKRANRRVTADLYDFLTFPTAGEGMPRDLDGPFRSNVRAFLARHARLPSPPSILSPPLATNLMTWRMAFKVGEVAGGGEEAAIGGAAVELDVVEEDVPRSRSMYCDQCRVVGWSGHPVCGKRYHFIIKNDCNISSSTHRACPRCGVTMHTLDLRCNSCNHELSGDDIEDWEYFQLENSTHLLHGVVHTNGYGHLLRVNGRQGGSKFLTGSDIMDFWDRLCKMLRVRKVSVMDISKKYDIEYRLLHAVTMERPWYGNWGYKFGAGSFGVTAEAYHKAVGTLSNVPLPLFFTHDRSPRTRLQNTIAFYWSLAESPLFMVRDLFRYLLDQLHNAWFASAAAAAGGKEKLLEPAASAGVLCTWTKEDSEQAEHAIIKVLQAVGGSRWVTLRALRGATFGAVASPQLLDYCLKGLGGKCFDNGMVVVRCNSDTKAIEYRLVAPADSHQQNPPAQLQCRPSPEQLLDDLKFLHGALLSPATMQLYNPPAVREASLSSARKLLDCKQFVKHYDDPTASEKSSNPFQLRVWCHVELIDQPKDCTAPPPELLVLPATATVADLKFQAAKAFRETYVLFQRFQAEQLLDYGHVSDSTHVKLLIGLDGSVRIRGSCSGDERRLWNFRMERGTDSWTVDCTCGAKDDDGERMMACDVCEVWRHTRCSGIGDHEEVPAKFICITCTVINNYKHRGGRVGERNKNGSSSGSGRCKDDIATSSSSSSMTESGRHERGATTFVQ